MVKPLHEIICFCSFSSKFYSHPPVSYFPALQPQHLIKHGGSSLAWLNLPVFLILLHSLLLHKVRLCLYLLRFIRFSFLLNSAPVLQGFVVFIGILCFVLVNLHFLPTLFACSVSCRIFFTLSSFSSKICCWDCRAVSLVSISNSSLLLYLSDWKSPAPVLLLLLSAFSSHIRKPTNAFHAFPFAAIPFGIVP